MIGLFEAAKTAHQAGQFTEAIAHYTQFIVENPHHAGAHYNLGLVYGQTNQPLAAVRSIAQSLTLNPSFADGWFMLADFADQTKNYTLMRFAGEQATRLNPSHARSWLRLGLAHSHLGDYQTAMEVLHKALTLDTNLINGWADYAYAAKRAGFPEAAEKALRMAIMTAGQTLDPMADESAYSPLHYYLSLAELSLGNYHDGFSHFRARYRQGTDWQRLASDKPLWTGQDLTHTTLLVVAEQGHGDALMFSRYIPLLKEKGATLIFMVHPALVSFYTGWDAVCQVIPLGTPIPNDLAYDWHTTLFDIPHILKTRVDTIPSHFPYHPSVRPSPLPNRLPHRRAVGLIYAGQPLNIAGRFRSLDCESLLPLLRRTDIQLYNMTRDRSSEERATLADHHVVDLTPMINNFSETAQFMQSCDLIITCDTATAHLAGGLSRPCWTFIPFIPDWRWGLHGKTSPWYPSMQLFRQTKPNQWTDVVTHVNQALDQWIATP